MKPDCLSKLEVVIRLLYFGVYLRYDVIENHKSTIFNSSICYFVLKQTPQIVFYYILLDYIFYILQLNYIRNYKSYIHTRDHFTWQIILNDIMQWFREKKCFRKLHRRNHDRLN